MGGEDAGSSPAAATHHAAPSDAAGRRSARAAPGPAAEIDGGGPGRGRWRRGEGATLAELAFSYDVGPSMITPRRGESQCPRMWLNHPLPRLRTKLHFLIRNSYTGT